MSATHTRPFQTGTEDTFFWNVAKPPAETRAKRPRWRPIRDDRERRQRQRSYRRQLQEATLQRSEDPDGSQSRRRSQRVRSAGRQGAAVLGGVMLPKPYGVWGLPEAEQMKLPGFGDPARQKAESKKLLAEAGFGPSKPLKINVSTRPSRSM